MSESPSSYEDVLEKKLESLEELVKEQLFLAKKMFEAYGGTFYAMDLFASAALNRSLQTASGFKIMVREKNIFCIGALLRIQLDTALRFFASSLVERPHEFVSAILDGAKIRDYKDESGKKLTDGYLVSRLSEIHPWVKNVYERTSGYVHFSGEHIFRTVEVSKTEKDEKTLRIGISACGNDSVGLKPFVEAIEAFKESTEILSQLIRGWILTKSFPEEVAKLRQESRRTSSSS